MEEKKKKKKTFLEKPLYPGGAKALREFVNAHLQYPQDAMESRIEGVVTVAYQVNDDGYVESPVIVKSLCPSCDAEALRIVRLIVPSCMITITLSRVYFTSHSIAG